MYTRALEIFNINAGNSFQMEKQENGNKTLYKTKPEAKKKTKRKTSVAENDHRDIKKTHLVT